MKHLFALTALLVIGGGCDRPPAVPADAGGDSTRGGDMAPSSLTYYDDVAPILARRCVRCHHPGAGDNVGVLLHDYTAVASVARRVADVVVDRSMPPFHADNSGSCNTFRTGMWLTQHEIDTLVTWAESGASAGAPEPIPEHDRAPRLGANTEPIGPHAAFVPDAGEPRDYRCFLITTEFDSDLFITGLEAVPGVPEMVHHVVLYDVHDDDRSKAEALEEEHDDGAGYECFGGPGFRYPAVLGLWAPGQGAVIYPEGTGIRLREGQSVVMQVHYDTSAVQPQADQTQVRLQLATDAEEAFIMATADLELARPAGAPDGESFTEDPHPMYGNAAFTRKPVAIHGVMPHMHRHGEQLFLEHIDSEGDGACLLSLKTWDFDDQDFYFFERPVVSRPGDRFRLRCRYNTSERAAWLPWGPKANEEMCVALAYVTAETNQTVEPTAVSGPIAALPGEDQYGELEAQPPFELGSAVPDWVTDVELTDDGTVLAAVGLITEWRPADDGYKVGRGLLLEIAGDQSEPDVLLSVDGPVIEGGGDFGLEEVKAVTPLDDGSLLVAGVYEPGALVNGTDILPSPDELDTFVLRLMPDGRTSLVQTLGGPGRQGTRSGQLRVDTSRGVVWTPFFTNAPTTFGAFALPAGDKDWTTGLIKFALDDGEPLWGTSFPVSGDVEFVADPRRGRIRSVALDDEGDVYFSGHFPGEIEIGSSKLRSRGFTDGFVGKIDGTTNEVQWLKQVGDENRDELAGLVVTDSVVHVSGTVTGPAALFDITAGGDAVAVSDDAMESWGGFSGGLDGVMLRLTTAGEWLSVTQIGGPHGEALHQFDILDDGTYVATGYTIGAGDFGQGPLRQAGVRDVALVGFDVDGTSVFSKRFGSNGREKGRVLDVLGDRVAIGYSSSTPANDPGARLQLITLP